VKKMGVKFGVKELELKKLSVCTLLIVVVFWAAVISMAHAAPDNETNIARPQTSAENVTVDSGDNPTLYAAEENNSILNDIPILTRDIDNSSALPEDNATLYTTQEDASILIAAQTQPDNSALIGGGAALVVAVVVAVAIVRRRKKPFP
jgi:uncharacterized protein (TIGR03382 family)